MADSAISWTDKTWNPVIGCTRVSAGCEHCYAEALAFRLVVMGKSDYAGLTRKHNDGSVNWTGTVRCLPERLAQPLGWKKPARVFVNSMSDLFHESVPDDFIDQVFAVMSLTGQHTYQVLTKRPERMLRYMTEDGIGRVGYIEGRAKRIAREAGIDLTGKTLAGYWPFPHVWLGVSTENQAAADERIPLLIQTPAAVRFISAEPLIGPIDFMRFFQRGYHCSQCGSTDLGLLEGWPRLPPICRRCGGLTASPLDWIITGGESGRNHRPFDPQWARDIRDQCQDNDVAFFHKQSGGPRPGMGMELDGRVHHEFPRAAVPV